MIGYGIPAIPIRREGGPWVLLYPGEGQARTSIRCPGISTIWFLL